MCDDGEVEWDLPALRNTDQLARIGFNQLALVVAPRRPTDATDSVRFVHGEMYRRVHISQNADSGYRMTVHFNIPHMVKLEIELDPDSTTVEELRNIAVAHLNEVRPPQHRAMTRVGALRHESPIKMHSHLQKPNTLCKDWTTRWELIQICLWTHC